VGRPYAEEIAMLSTTYSWAQAIDVKQLSEAVNMLRGRPLLVVGSGGSASACHFAARLHESHARLSARVLTPLEFIQHPIPQAAGVLLLSASGSNPDILAAAAHAIAAEYTSVVGLCTRSDTPLRRALVLHRHATVIEYTGPSAKDGFLATNSLLLTVVVVARAYGIVLPPELPSLAPSAADSESAMLVAEASRRHTIIALATGWATAAAFDLESKWSEIGFGVVTVTDVRNFAHGRHYGLSRRLEHTVMIGLVTPDEAALTERTFKLLPDDVCRMILTTPLAGESGGIDLLAKVIQLIGAVGSALGLDPGRPVVPAFGRALYHAAIPRRPRVSQSGPNPGNAVVAQRVEDNWIRRKVSPAVWEDATESIREHWRAHCQSWVAAAQSAVIGGVVFDYDGTLCEVDERFETPATAIGEAVARLVDDGLRIGVATGRGDSVLTALRAVIPQRVWPEITVGMYNGGQICMLNEQPCTSDDLRDEIHRVQMLLGASPIIRAVARFRARPTQLTVHAERPLPDGLLQRMVLEALLAADHPIPVDVFASGHTVDIIPRGVSKLLVVEAVRTTIPIVTDLLPSYVDSWTNPPNNETPRIMTIGDQGQAGGNDAPFLAHQLGISVENVSSVFDACWNVAPSGTRRTSALLRYLGALRRDRSGSFRWSVAHASHSGRPTRPPREVVATTPKRGR